jgi:5-methylthioadenosine/S-adenosylhomocysteine deaminase
LGGARALGQDREIGSLEVGKQADLVVFDARNPHLRPHVDPAGVLVHCGQGRDVEMVLVAGDAVVEGGRPTHVDMERVCAEGEQAARELWASEGRRY